MAVQVKNSAGVAKRLFNVTEYHRLGDVGIFMEDDPVELIEGEIIEKTSQGVAKYLFNVTEYHRLGDAGILSEDDRVELINGEIIEMSPIGSLHASCVKRMARLLYRKLGETVLVGTQDPVELDDGLEPQPDLSILKPHEDEYARAHPRPPDVLLIIEVADSSIEYDRSIKLPLYANAGIPETWIVNLNDETIEQFSAPRNGEYVDRRVAHRGDMLSSSSVPTLTLSVDEILG